MKIYTFFNVCDVYGEWLVSRFGRFTPEITQYQLYRRLGGPQGPSGRVQKMFPPAGFDSWTVQAITSRYTALAILAYTPR